LCGFGFYFIGWIAVEGDARSEEESLSTVGVGLEKEGLSRR